MRLCWSAGSLAQCAVLLLTAVELRKAANAAQTCAWTMVGTCMLQSGPMATARSEVWMYAVLLEVGKGLNPKP